LTSGSIQNPLSGPAWGTFATIVSLFSPDDGGNVLANYTTY
jgi:hypothetical protein